MSATRDEVLRAMAEAVDSGVQQALRDYGISDEVIGADVERFAASLTTASYALAAAEQAGWRLVPAEADEAMERLREAVGELERAWAFHDRVMSSSPDERSAVGQDHYNWCERAARNAIRAIQP